MHKGLLWIHECHGILGKLRLCGALAVHAGIQHMQRCGHRLQHSLFVNIGTDCSYGLWQCDVIQLLAIVVASSQAFQSFLPE